MVVATRSGVFAPVQNLGLILVDEEHDQSYKQQETPRYHWPRCGGDARAARQSGRSAGLGDAWPGIPPATAESGKYSLLELPQRIERRPMPDVRLVDMRQEFLETRKHATFSRALIDAVTARLENGEQSMLLLNRRGFSSFVACRACGQRVECTNCSVTLTFHRRDRRMLCHYCNYSERVPERCPTCDSEYIQFMGLGSERVEAELNGAFPKARIARLDRDAINGKRDYETILAGFRDGDYDILVGTQMIAKGHDIPNVTLVGIVELVRYRSWSAGFPRRRAHLPVADAGGGPGWPRRNSGHRSDPNHQPGSLRHPVCRRAGLPGLLPKRNSVPPRPQLPALHGAGKCHCARPQRRGGSLPQRRAGALAATGSRRSASDGTGGGALAPARIKNEYRFQLLLKAATRKRTSSRSWVTCAPLRGSRKMECYGAGDRRRSHDVAVTVL